MLPAAAPGFDAPLDLLRACHARIERQCATLVRLVDHLRTTGLDAAAREAAREVHRYFSTAARHHHEDEEQDLFPLLRADPALAARLTELEGEHRRLTALWDRLEPLLAAPETIRDLDDFARRVAEFKALYARHIAHENGELLPRAAVLLPPPVLAAMGARMAARRGVTL